MRTVVYKNCYTYNPDEKIQSMRPIWWLTDEDKSYYVECFDIQFSDCYTLYGLKRTGCAGCPFGSSFEDELKILEINEPKLYRAIANIFGASYEYTRKYRQFKEAVKAELKEQNKTKRRNT